MKTLSEVLQPYLEDFVEEILGEIDMDLEGTKPKITIEFYKKISLENLSDKQKALLKEKGF